MMMRWLPIALVGLCACMVLAQPEQVIVRDSAVFKPGNRPAVVFPHNKHLNIDSVTCLTCHHRFEKEKNILDEGELVEGNANIKCSACHVGARALQKAYHRQCVECHNKTKKQKKVTGPRLCAECHRWKK